MAEIRPFRGFRYGRGTDHLSALTAPPYDVISDTDSERLHAASPHNIVRVILGRERESDSEQDNRYTRARDHLRAWIHDGTLVEESAPALYVYDQTFRLRDASYTRRGFMSAVRLEPWGRGGIYPHENTMPGPKVDRLKLMRATGFNTSAIFALCDDADGAVQRLLQRTVNREPDAWAAESDDVQHRLWALTDADVIAEFTTALASLNIYIADGHHRYETALAYRDELRARGEKKDVTGADCVLMMIVPAQDPGMVILPTHRCVHGLKDFDAAKLWAKLGERFELTPATREEIVQLAEQDAGQSAGAVPVLVLGAAAGGQHRLLRLKHPREMDARAEAGRHRRHLDVTALHLLILEDILGIDAAALASQANVQYMRDASEAMRLAETGAGGVQAAFVLRPPSVQSIMAVSEAGERLPQKTTYFYPKLLSGLVLRRIVD